MAVYLMDVSVRDMVCAWMLGVSSLVSVCIHSPCACMSMNRNVSYDLCVCVCMHVSTCICTCTLTRTRPPSLRPSFLPSLPQVCEEFFYDIYTRGCKGQEGVDDMKTLPGGLLVPRQDTLPH